MSHHLTLDGLRLEPLASYTGALGVLRLVAEQADPSAQGWWQNERFQLRSKLDESDLVRFFLQDYCPTPMASPWNAGGGFFGRSSYSGITKIEQSDDPRFADYRQAFAIIYQTLEAHNLKERPRTPSLKLALLQSLHNDLTPVARRYLDTVFSLEGDDVTYHALFITGGNSGKLDFARNFMDRLAPLLLGCQDQTPPWSPASESLLRSALFDTLTDQLETNAAGPHDPGSSGGLNASCVESGRDNALCNSWAYVLGMEGTLLLSGGKAEAPHSSVGYASAIPAETGMRDLRLPIWSTSMTLEQVQEQLEGQPENHHLRYALFPRNGRAYFAVPVERRSPSAERSLDYLKGLEPQLKDFAPRDLRRTLCEEPANAGRILETLGTLRGEREKLPTLLRDWVAAADDGTPEFGCALALSGLGRGLRDPHLSLEPQLPHFVGSDLCARMLALLRLRARWANETSKRPTSGGYPRFNAPFWSTHPIRPRHLEAFLFQKLDEARIERLFRGLRLLEPSNAEPPHEPAFLPYALAMSLLALHQHYDRRPAPVEIAEAWVANQPDRAVSLAARFLSHRHPDFPQDWPPCPALDAATSRRWAAALLFPISDATYQAILGDLCA